jgi:hypothetical protein
MTVRKLFALAVIGVIAVAARPAIAQPAGDTPPDTAVKADAAPADKEVCLASFGEAQTLRKRGALLASRGELLKCGREKCPEIIKSQCMTWLHEIDRDIPSIIVVARDSKGVDLPDASYFVDGVPIPAADHGKPLQIDPGPHEVRVVVAKHDIVRKVVAVLGDKRRMVKIELPAPEKLKPRAEVTNKPIGKTAKAAADGADEGDSSSGLYAALTGGVLGLLNAEVENTDVAFGYQRFGAIVGAIGGWRVADWAAFELLVQFHDYRVQLLPAGGDGRKQKARFILTATRFGTLFRVRYPHDTRVRFAGAMGAGLSYDVLTWSNAAALNSTEHPNTSSFLKSESGIDGFAMFDLTAELDVDRVLLQLGVQGIVHITKGLQNFDVPDGQSPYTNFDRALLMLGPVARVGYAF